MVRVEDQMREGRGIFEVSSSPFYHLPPNPSQPQQPQENFRRSSQLKSNPRLRSFSAFLTQKTLNLWAALTRSPSLLLASSPLLLDELLLLPTPSEDAKPLQDPCFLHKSQSSFLNSFPISFSRRANSPQSFALLPDRHLPLRLLRSLDLGNSPTSQHPRDSGHATGQSLESSRRQLGRSGSHRLVQHCAFATPAPLLLFSFLSSS